MNYVSSYEKAAYLYDLFDQKPNIDFFASHASGFKEILDIGAGTGRIALPMAERGCCVFCIEPSSAMRREFRKKLRKRKDIADRIVLKPGEAGSFRIDRTFGFAFMSGVFDHFLSDSHRLSVLRNVCRHLKPNGRFVFDLAGARPVERQCLLGGQHRLDNRTIRRYIRSEPYRKDTYRMTIVYEIHESGKKHKCIEETGLVGFVSKKRISILLREAGFHIAHEYGGYDSSDHVAGGNLLIIEALKKVDRGEAH